LTDPGLKWEAEHAMSVLAMPGLKGDFSVDVW
jgi:hypothetical protein